MDVAVYARRHALDTQHRVVIVGGGLGGLFGACFETGSGPGNADRPAKLPPVPAAALPGRHRRPVCGQYCFPAAHVLKRQQNAEVRLGEVADFDVTNRQVLLTDTGKIGYDTLIVAAGSAPTTLDTMNGKQRPLR